jgi:hypothetical protein
MKFVLVRRPKSRNELLHGEVNADQGVSRFTRVPEAQLEAPLRQVRQAERDGA